MTNICQPLHAPVDRISWRLPVVLAGVAALALTFDLPVERWILAGGLPKGLVKICSLSEIFAHGFGVLLVAAIVWTLDRDRRAAVPRVLAAAFGAGLCANVIKLLVTRSRPNHFDFAGGVLDTFGPLVPLGQGGHAVQGFPSSHAATAAGLAVALAWLYPHAARLFAVLVALACLQRLAAGAHFPSDVLAGSALGITFGRLCVDRGALARWFDRLEARWATHSVPGRDQPAGEMSTRTAA